MDLPRLALIDSLRLRLSADGRKSLYLAEDSANGRIFTLPANLVLALRRMQAARRGDAQAREALDETAARQAYGFLSSLEATRDADTLKTKPFNPVFMNFPLFDVGPFQPALRGLAHVVVSWSAAMMFLLLLGIVLVLGVQSDWSILSAFSGIFSTQALLTFAFAAPFLKLVHELGHVLVATWAGVRVRKAGVLLIGLYPLPFVDCTEADVSARRSHRVMISLAGLVVDLTIGMLAFVGWYLVEGDFLRALLGNIFVFATLNSLLFNANPLIKLDGYYALVDLVGARNLYTRAARTLQDTRLWVGTLGAKGHRPASWRHWGLISYAIAAYGYRIYILYIIAVALVPRYLGAGAAITAWGAAVMLLSPVMQDRPAQQKQPADIRARIWGVRLTVLVLLALALMFVRLPFRTVVPVALDIEGHYQITTDSAGFLAEPLRTKDAKMGVALITLENATLKDELDLAEQNISGAILALDAVRGESAVKTLAAEQSLTNFQTQRALLQAQTDGLSVAATNAGLFVPTAPVPNGSFVDSGQPIGALYPRTGVAHMIGPFSERYIDKFNAGADQITLKLGQSYIEIQAEQIALQTRITYDAESGKRAYQMTAQLDIPPAELAGMPGHIRLRFPAEPLWSHLRFVGQNILVAFREAQLLDRESLLNTR